MDFKLTSADPTIYAKCPRCTRYGTGVVIGNYFASTFSRNDWKKKKNQSCPNCGTKLEIVREAR